MTRSKVMFAKIVDMLLHWLRVDTHGNIFYYPNVMKLKFLDLCVPEMALDLF